jgi:hypothetical protein
MCREEDGSDAPLAPWRPEPIEAQAVDEPPTK